MFQAINNALDTALRTDENACVFGEDVAFGGVFRCTLDLQVTILKFMQTINLRIHLREYKYNIFRKNMVVIVFSIHPYASKVLLVLVLA